MPFLYKHFHFRHLAKMISTVLLTLLVSGTLAGFVPFIHGGNKAAKDQFPFLVSLRKLSKTGIYKHDCGATILSDRFLVTAAHCWNSSRTLDDYRVSVGPYKKEDEGEFYSVEKFIIHPQYDVLQNVNDMALVKMKESIRISERAAAIEIGREFIKGEVEALIIGWGKSEVC